MKTLAHPLARVALVAALAAALPACTRSDAQANAPAAPAPEVITVVARPASDRVDLVLPARAQPDESASLYARATGFVTERRVDLGDRVEKDQVLATIATPEVDQGVREAQALLAKAQADQQLAEVNFARAKTLVGTGAISKELYNEREAAIGVSAAALSAAQARLASARDRQSFQTVRAPFAGVVVARAVERGDRVVADAAASTTPMFQISVLDPLRVVVDVPQHAALQVRPGMAVDVTFPELPGETFHAEVARSAGALSRDAGTMRTELRLPNPDGRIPAGMIGSAALHLPRATRAVVLPLSALVQRGSLTQVAVVGADSTLAYRDVTPGRNLGNEVEILAGIAPGDTVVLAPNALIAPGTAVRAKVRDAAP